MIAPAIRLSALLTAALCSAALAGGTPENAVIIVNPANPDSLYIANYYKNARSIPDANVIFLDSAAFSYQNFAAFQTVAFLAALDQHGITDHADYAVVSPTSTFFIPAPGLVADGCSPITRFSLASVYTMSFIRSEVLSGTLNQAASNRYFSTSDAAIAFDSSSGWLGGFPNSTASARRYFIGAMLGYSGLRGNSVEEITAMIDRSVAADGSRPPGAFYYMNNLSDPARNVRACGTNNCTIPTFYNLARSSILGLGGNAEIIVNELPPGRTDCLGIMTGVTNINLPGFEVALIPGAFGDHLTSFAATFDQAAQSKVSEWVRHGASGSAGTVQEPCNYTGKFPNARFHVYYFQGLSLGESYLRSSQFVPFQGLLYGDPLTRPFAHIPAVNVPDAPSGPVSGTITLSPQASTSHPTAAIAGFELFIDGISRGTILPSQQFTIDTPALDDGWHDLRVTAFDSTTVRSTGRWIGSLTVNNRGQSASISPPAASATLDQPVTFNLAAAGAAVREIRLVQNGRVLGAVQGAGGSVTIHGQILGAGTSTVRAVAVFQNGRTASSAPAQVAIARAGTPAHVAPVAYSYSKDAFTPTPYLVELPATYDSDPRDAVYTLLTTPAQAALVGPAYDGPYRIIRPNAGATGSETFTFRVTAPGGQSNTASVTLNYSPPETCRPDWNESGDLNSQDFFDFLTDFFAGSADYNMDGITNSQDFFDFVVDFFTGCP